MVPGWEGGGGEGEGVWVVGLEGGFEVTFNSVGGEGV